MNKIYKLSNWTSLDTNLCSSSAYKVSLFFRSYQLKLNSDDTTIIKLKVLLFNL